VVGAYRAAPASSTTTAVLILLRELAQVVRATLLWTLPLLVCDELSTANRSLSVVPTGEPAQGDASTARAFHSS
jgi:hypothetical protein